MAFGAADCIFFGDFCQLFFYGFLFFCRNKEAGESSAGLPGIQEDAVEAQVDRFGVVMIFGRKNHIGRFTAQFQTDVFH